MKKQWKKVFEEKVDEVFDVILSNSSLKENTLPGLDDDQIRAALENGISTMDDNIFKFIKVD